MRYSVKLMLKKEKITDGKHPVYLRIIIDGKVSYISTSHSIPAKYWDEKKEQVKDSHLLASTINLDINTWKQTALKEIVTRQSNGEVITAIQLKEKITGRTDSNNFFDFVDLYINEVKNKRSDGTLANYKRFIKKLEDYHGSRNLSFEQIDRKYLSAYENHLHEKSGTNYISTLLGTIKTMFSAARKQGVTKSNPFENYEIPEYLAPGKEYLTLDEIKQLENYKTDCRFKHQAARWLLVACYTGLRVSDWKKLNIVDGVIRLRAKKNNEWVTMPVSSGLKRVMKDLPPITINESALNKALKKVFEELKIHKSISTHCGRHTFAITMCSARKIRSEVCAELMGITIATCVESYYRVTNQSIMDETKKAWKGL